jgi:thiamine biosynthesis lipoprotein
MGTDIELMSARDLDGATVDSVRNWFEEVESRLSRFRPASELSMLNASGGRPFLASPMLREVLRGAWAAARESDGLFDPTVLRNVQAAGYRESFETLGPDVEAGDAVATRGKDEIDITDEAITLPEGVGIDLGGYAKGWTVDRAARLLRGCEPWLLNAGGDMLGNGDGPEGEGWLIGVEDPYARGADQLVLRVRDRAVATSTTMRRRWLTTDGQVGHHLIDPRTGRPSESDLASVTVVARTTVEAEVQAKVLLLLGRRAAMEKIAREGLSAVLIDTAGASTVLRGAGDFELA